MRCVLAALLLLSLLQVGCTLIILPLMNAAYASNLGEHTRDVETAKKVYQLVLEYPPYRVDMITFFGLLAVSLSGFALYLTRHGLQRNELSAKIQNRLPRPEE